MSDQIETEYESEYSMAEEIANAVTHGIGALLSVAALTLMVMVALNSEDPTRLISAYVYGISLVVLFCVSTMYHSIPGSRTKNILQLIDHMAIYLLIAGTYTPVLLISMKGAWGYSLLGIIWCMALFGIVFKIIYRMKHPRISLFTYIAMSWCILVASSELFAKVPPGALWLLLIGGIIYTLGTIFYTMDNIPYNHAVWHIFVLGGSAFHFFAVYLYIITPAPVTG